MTHTPAGSRNGMPARDPARGAGASAGRPAVRYATALGLTAAACLVVWTVDAALEFPPFVVFALAAGLTRLLSGFGPTLLSIAAGALSSDYFFVNPRYELSLNQTTAGLASVYVGCAVAARAAAYWADKRGRAA